MPSARKKCICQLCTCGRHMCPHRRKDQVILGDDQQHSGKKSLDQEAATRNARKKHRKQWDLQNGSVQSVTSSTDHENAKHLATSLTVEDKGNSQIITRNGKRWSAKQIRKTLPIKRPDNLRPEGDADFKTTHQQDFTKKSSEQLVVGAGHIATAAEIKEESWNKRQIPKTQIIKKPDTLTFSGPLNLETTHKVEFNERAFESKGTQEISETVARNETFQRPRTSLKLSGEFQSDSSYQQAFTAKQSEDGFRVKKGASIGHLRPEGKMRFDTTSLDYSSAQSVQASRASESSEAVIVLKPKAARPQSEIKIPDVPISDQTTVDTDYKTWNVEKPQRYKPHDTLQIGDGSETEIKSFHSEHKSSMSDASNAETTMGDYKAWQTSRPVVQKPVNNLKSEGDFSFETTSDTDYSSSKRERVRKMQSSLETLTERTERESIEPPTAERKISEFITAEQNGGMETSRKAGDDGQEISTRIIDTDKSYQDLSMQADTSDVNRTETLGQTDIASLSQEAHVHQDETDMASQIEDQGQYLTWDEIRPKPIRPHSNLRQEGDMEFNTTNRSEFVERSTERVKGVRPKTTTKMFEGDFDATTMNNVMFSNDQGERVNPIRPKSNLHVEGGDFVDETTSSREFQQWQVKRPSPIVPKSNLTQEGTIDFTTTNHTDFEEKHPEKVYPIRPTTTNRISGEIDLKTTNSLMHAELPIERVQKIVPQSNLRISSGEFNTETTNKTQFQDWGIDRPKPIRPVSNLKQEGSMDFVTMNDLQFDEKQMEKVTPFRPHTSTKISGTFDGTTTNQVMYAAQPLERPQMAKTKTSLEVGKGKFTSDTTNHSEYQQWQLSRSKAVAPRNNLHQGGDIDFSTTNQQQYGIKTIDRVSEIRPKTNSKITGEFDSTTTNQIMFQNLPSEKQKAVRPQTNIKLETGNFTSETTNNREFQTWDYSKPSPIKPHSSIRQEGDMDFTTTNTAQFEGKTPERVSQIRPITSTKITGDFDGTTTNQVMFKNNKVEKVIGHRPTTNIHLEKAKFEDGTTNRREFQKWDASKPEAIRPSNNIMMEEGKMEFATSNLTDYGQKPIIKVEQIRPHTTSPVTGDFDGTTTNQVMYQGEQSVDKVHNVRPKDNLRMSSGQFNDQTTSSEAYGLKEGSKTDSIIPKPNLSQEGDFDFTTSNQVQFEGRQLDKVAQTRPKTLTKMSEGTFYSTTTNQAAFPAPVMETVHEIKPINNLHVEGSQLQSISTATDEHRPWQIEKPKSFQLVSSLKQEGDMQFETTNNSEFKERNFDRVQPIRPKTTSKIEGDFEATTTNQVMFRQPDKAERVQPIRHQNNLYLESGKISNETTTGKEFRQWVKMEKKDSSSRKTSQAAGVSSRKGDARRKKETQVSDKNKTQSSEHEPWQVKKDDTGAYLPSDKEHILHTRLSAENTSEGRSVRLVEAGSVSRRKDASQTSDLKSSTKHATLDNALQNTGVTAKSPERKSVHAQIKQASSRDISATMADYGSNQVKKENGVTSSVNLTHEAETNGSSSERKDFLPQAASTPNEKYSIHQDSQVNTEVSRNSKFIESTGHESWKLSERNTDVDSGVRTNAVTGTGNLFSSNDTFTIENGSPSNSPNRVVKVQRRFKPDDNLKLDHAPFDGLSTSRTEYKKWDVKRSSPVKRGETLKQEGSMEFKTTSNDYAMTKAYQISRETTKAKSKADQRGTLGETGSMEFSTTSKSSYTGNTASRSKNLRPRSSLRLGGEDAISYEPGVSSRSNPETSTREYQEMTSTSRASYMGHTPSRRTRAHRPTTSQKVGQGHFEGQSTTRSSFTAPLESPVKYRALKPENHNILNTANVFSGDTTYRSSFESEKVHLCPVIDLQAGRSGLAFNEERNGHIFYAPRVQG